MTLALDLPAIPESPVRRLDPRWKLAGIAGAVVGVSLLRTVPTSLAGLVAAVVLLAVSRLPPRWWGARLAATALLLLPFAVFLPLLTPVLTPGEAIVHAGPIAISGPGLRLAVVLYAKALTVVGLVLVLLGTAPLPATLQAAHALHAPGLLVQLGVLTYRYLFVLGGELARLRIALRVRGYRNRPTRHGYRTVGHVAGTLLVRGYERAERVGQAMTCRGFDGRFRSLAVFRTTTADVLFFLGTSAATLGLLAWDFVRR